MLITILLPNYELILYTIKSNVFETSDKIKILYSSLGSFSTNFTLYSQVTSIIIALLAGINITLLVHYFRKRMALQKAAGTSMVGLVAGFLGIGCSACGSVVLSTIFGIGATSAVIGFLPFKGAEIGIFSILILGGSILFVANSFNKPIACKIKSYN